MRDQKVQFIAYSAVGLAALYLAYKIYKTSPTQLKQQRQKLESFPVGKIKNIDFFPFKGCQAIELKTAMLTNLGLRDIKSGIYDRQFMIYRPDTNSMVSPKNTPKLAVLNCQIISRFQVSQKNTRKVEYGVKIWFDAYENQPKSDSVEIFPDLENSHMYHNIDICSKPGSALDCGDAAAEFVTHWIDLYHENQAAEAVEAAESDTNAPARAKIQYRVVYFDIENCLRDTEEIMESRQNLIGKTLPENLDLKCTLSDVGPYCISSSDSHTFLDQEIQKAEALNSSGPLDPKAFRSSLTIDSIAYPRQLSPFMEDKWRKIWFGKFTNKSIFSLTYYAKCPRCTFTNLNPKTGKSRADGQPLKWLLKNRKIPENEVEAYCGGVKSHYANYFALDTTSRINKMQISVGDLVFAEMK